MLLSAGPAAEPVKLRDRIDRGALARAVCHRADFGRTRGDWCSSASKPPTGPSATARRRRCEGYDAASLDDVLAALEDCREPLSQSDGEDRDGAAGRVRAAGGPAPRGRRDRPGAVGSRGPAQRRARVAACSARDAAPASVEVNATIAAADRAGAAAEAAAARQAGFRSDQAEGRHRRRRRPARRRARGRRPARCRSASTPTAPGRSAEAAAALRALAPAGVELCEEPVHGLEQTAELNATTDVPIAIDESTREPGALDRRVCDAVCLKIARGGGITRRDRAGPARPGRRLRGLSRLNPRRSAGDRRGAARRRRDQARPPLRPGDARRVRRSQQTRSRPHNGRIAAPPAPASATACSAGASRRRRSATRPLVAAPTPRAWHRVAGRAGLSR